MKLRLASCVALLLSLSACANSETADSLDPNPTTPPSPTAVNCAPTSWVAGVTDLCAGQLIYRDYVYDDRGATNPTYDDIGKLSSAAGSQKYPAGQENTADLVELQLSIRGDQLHVRALLNTLFDAKSTLLGVAIDTDNNPQTGGGDWTPLLTRSSGWELFEVFDEGNTETNVIEGQLPLPSGAQWRVQAALAQADGRVMNVAFRGPNEGAAGLYGLPPPRWGP